MDERAEFLDWFGTTWRAAETSLHDGDAAPRDGTWSRQPPVTLFGAWYDATGPDAVRAVFDALAEGFGGSVAADVEVVAADVSGDLAYTVHPEHTTTLMNGEERSYVLRVTQVYRREPGGWKVVHRHGDSGPTAP